MPELIMAETFPLTRENAIAHSSLPAWKGDRPRDDQRAMLRRAWLRSKLDDGLFHSPHWARAWLDGVLYRVNGGTSSLVLSEYPGPLPSQAKIFVEEFIVKDAVDMSILFDQFDQRNSIRTAIESIKAHKVAQPGLETVSATSVKICLTGIVYYQEGNTRDIPETERVKLIHRHAGFLQWAKPFVGRRHLRDRGTVAAMFKFYLRHPEWATEFWSLVRDEAHPDNQHSTRKLGKFLLESKGWDARAVMVKCHHAWNAWRTNTSTTLRYVPDAPVPPLV